MLTDTPTDPSLSSSPAGTSFTNEIDLGDRAVWLGILARSGFDDIMVHLRSAPPLPDFTLLRHAETGMAMVRGRIGGAGAPFNLGEITISRCSIRDATGAIGHGYATGRDLRQVELIARLDAVLQNPALHAPMAATVLTPLAARIADRRAAIEAQARETEVKFFTLAAMRS